MYKMFMPKKIHLCLLIAFFCSCQQKVKHNEVGNPESPKDTVISEQTENSSFDSVDVVTEESDEEFIMDPIEFMPPIEANGYYGITVGENIKTSKDVLFPGVFRTGEGFFDVHYILFQKDTLGYVYGSDKVKSIHIWDHRGATHEGIRVGMAFGEVNQLLKELESRAYIVMEKHSYRLDYNSTANPIDPNHIPDTVKIQEIIISR